MQHLSIPRRVALIVALLVISVVGVVAMQAVSFRQAMVQERKDKLIDMVTGLVSTIKYYDSQVAAGKMTLEQAQQEATTTARAMRWREDGYFGIYQYDGVTLVHANPKA